MVFTDLGVETAELALIVVFVRVNVFAPVVEINFAHWMLNDYADSFQVDIAVVDEVILAVEIQQLAFHDVVVVSTYALQHPKSVVKVLAH